MDMKTRSERRILQVTANPFPPEIRVVKEALSLQKAGFSSAVLCPPLAGKPEREQWRGIQIFRPRSLGRARGVWDKLLMQTSFFSGAWYRAMRETMAEYQPDVLHIHDIWLGRTALWARSNQQVVLDLHENMPAAVVEYLKGYRGLFKAFNAVFKSHLRVLHYERALLMKSDKAFAVVEEARNRILQNHPGLDRGKVVNIENLESKEFVEEKAPAEPVIPKDHFSVLYIGGFGPHRGIETLIRAMVPIKQWGLNVRVHLVGARDSQYLDMLKDLIRRLDVPEHVLVRGWVPADLVLAYIRQADVGAVPHHSNPHTDNTIPHKLFQYMIARTPVLVSTSPPLARTVRQAGAGTIFQAGDERDCAEKIREMFNDRDALRAYAGNGFRYVMQQGHNWEEESAPVLISAYDAMLGTQGSSASE
jgi:glycosyltransferase involved in cell wall biosynthesis